MMMKLMTMWLIMIKKSVDDDDDAEVDDDEVDDDEVDDDYEIC